MTPMDTSTDTITTVTTTVDTYLAAYGEPDPDVRAVRIQAAWSEDGRLIDPPAVRDCLLYTSPSPRDS